MVNIANPRFPGNPALPAQFLIPTVNSPTQPSLLSPLSLLRSPASAPLFGLMALSFLTQQSLSKSAFFRQNSERRNFKLLDTRKLSRDGAGSPVRASPPSTPSSPDDTFFNLGDLQNGRKKKKIPRVTHTLDFEVWDAPPLLYKRKLRRDKMRVSAFCITRGQGDTVKPADQDVWVVFCYYCCPVLFPLAIPLPPPEQSLPVSVTALTALELTL